MIDPHAVEEIPMSTAQTQTTFAPLLKHWRNKRKVSQLDLSLAAEVSQRHISFIESGRAAPSRGMVLNLSDALDVPLRDRNRLLTAAGFAPVYEARPLTDPDMTPITAALERVMAHHEPNPAVVVDRNWRVVMHNKALHRAFTVLLGDLDAAWARVGPDGERNLLKLVFHPDGARGHIANWQEVGPILLGRARREAELDGNTELTALLDEIRAYPGIPKRWHTPEWQMTPPPVLPLEYDVDGTRLRLFSMMSTFGTALDITTDELRIESFFPVDEASAALLRELAKMPEH